MLKTHNPTRIFQAESLFEAALNLGFPAAVWRLPHSHEVNLLISLQDGMQRRLPDLEELPACFVIHPFEPLESGEAFVLEGDLIFTFSEDWSCKEVAGNLGQEHPFVKRLLEKADEMSDENPGGTSSWIGFALNPEVDPEEKNHFEKAVTEAVAAISRGDFAKIVLSRTKTLTYSPEFQFFKAFKKLCVAYPSAFVSLVNLADRDEMWLGATPETLVGVNGEGTFSTTSLAGTQSALENGALVSAHDIRWGQKEIQEQALVSRYIIECFKKIRLREYQERGPRTVRAGNLYHLRTDFAVNTHDVNFPELGTVMLKLLHPTSAVCGMPKESALRFIKAVEGYDRSFYSGYLGPVNVDGESALFVNLRSLRLADGLATFFAGAGITEDSDPQREWDETEMKCDTLLSVLR
ncbi:chorismate-binding protein [Persicitalea jodogahamensis]|uniref:Chorismate-utilising enzyme C-terminal domain-containing protein n=1 Tax=Persicitalea jodogahamensis TaxID=402147 RepID=A0A8J3DB01_9BACT|nr:chorismate-binding protein [Persicitalea jodogahamensis]GHB76847.1 hypothetical protein GCM10007390_33530 [Persicitalea jodogahamensis]